MRSPMTPASRQRWQPGLIPTSAARTMAVVALLAGFIVEGERALVEQCRSRAVVCPVVTLETPARPVDTVPPSRETTPRRPQESTDRPGLVPEGQ